MVTLTKAEIVLALHQKIGFNKREAKEVVDLFIDELIHHLAEGGPVKLSGFGNFLVRSKHQRPGRNPKTGEEIAITSRKVVVFKAGLKLRSRTTDGLSEPDPSEPALL